MDLSLLGLELGSCNNESDRGSTVYVHVHVHQRKIILTSIWDSILGLFNPSQLFLPLSQ